MHTDSGPVAQPKPAQRQPGTRAARRAWGFDRRTNESKRLLAIMQDLARESGVPLDTADAVLRRAAELSLACEVARRDLIRRAPGIDIDLCLRMEGIAARAQRDLHSRARAKETRGPATPTLADVMREIASEEGA